MKELPIIALLIKIASFILGVTTKYVREATIDIIKKENISYI